MLGTSTALDALIEQSTQEQHDFGGGLTTEYIVQLAEGVRLNFFATDYSAALTFAATKAQLEFFIDEDIAGVLINREVSTVSDFFRLVAGVTA